MNVTTRKSEHDPKQQARQLEVAIEHAVAAAQSTVADSDGNNRMLIEVKYPSYQFRETLKEVRPSGEHQGHWIVLGDNNISTLEGCAAACRVLRHYYPDEDFVVASQVEEAALDLVSKL